MFKCLSIYYETNYARNYHIISLLVSTKQNIFLHIYFRETKTESPYTLRLRSFPLQYNTAVSVLINVATIAGAMIPAGFTLPSPFSDTRLLIPRRPPLLFQFRQFFHRLQPGLCQVNDTNFIKVSAYVASIQLHRRNPSIIFQINNSSYTSLNEIKSYCKSYCFICIWKKLIRINITSAIATDPHPW